MNEANNHMNQNRNGNNESEFITKFLPMFSIVLFLMAVRYLLNGKTVMGIIWIVFGISFIVVSAISKKKKK